MTSCTAAATSTASSSNAFRQYASWATSGVKTTTPYPKCTCAGDGRSSNLRTSAEHISCRIRSCHYWKRRDRSSQCVSRRSAHLRHREPLAHPRLPDRFIALDGGFGLVAIEIDAHAHHHHSAAGECASVRRSGRGRVE